MEKIEAVFRIVTPMFMGGADQEKAELRVPSIKGALRFWYRAIFPNEDAQEETRIFGGTDNSAGPSKILLRLSEVKITQGKKGDKRWAGRECNIPYLGYGLMDRLPTGVTFRDKSGHQKKEQKVMTVRNYIKENSTFKLTILFRPHTSEEEMAKVRHALRAIIMFGGLGSRSRKGFGSIIAGDSISGLSAPSLQPKNDKELAVAIAEFWKGIHHCCSALPDYSCFSTATRCIVTGHTQSAMDSLEWLAEKIVSLRSYKRSNSRLPFVKDDHDIMRDFIGRGDIPKTPPKRAAFGLPHNYYFTSIDSDRGGGVDLMEKGKKARRASPLFFKIHQFPNGQACTVATFLPARLIPQEKKVVLTGGCHKGNCKYNEELSLPDDFSAVDLLLDELKKQGTEVLRP
ncbi:MAG: type III-B CRISPR module RAMP protein Cmr1 [Candidatus Electrothrix sp. AR4]|nr:type III-B CRISPR module RAMP protein Cmr1 [Candidatus Electrothrix sp. AR4]